MIRLALGRKERGKTTFLYYLVSKLIARGGRAVIFDPRRLLRRPGSAIAHSVDRFRDGMAALADGEILELVYQPDDDLKTIAFPVFAAEVKQWIDTTPTIPLGVMVDEISFVNILEPDFEWALKCCRQDTIQFFLSCHRPVDVPTDIRSLSDHWYLFQAFEESDLDKIEERCGPRAAAIVAQLSGSLCLGWSNGELVPYYDPTVWYCDLRPAVMVVPPIELDSPAAPGVA